MQTITTEKENRVIEVLMSPASPVQLLAGKILGLGLVGFAQLALWLFSALSALNLARSVPYVSTLLGSITPATTWLAVRRAGLLHLCQPDGRAGRPDARLARGRPVHVSVIVPVLIPVYINQAIMSQPNSAIAVFLSMFPAHRADGDGDADDPDRRAGLAIGFDRCGDGHHRCAGPVRLGPGVPGPDLAGPAASRRCARCFRR